MNNSKLNWLLIGIIAIFIVWTFVIGRKEKEKIVLKTDTLTVVKYEYKTVKVPEYLNPTIQYLPYTDTVFVKDSVKIAKADSISDKDKTFTLYDLQYWYPPVNKFTFGNVKVKETIKETFITKEVLKPESFFDRFGWDINASFGYGLINKQFDIYIGVGASFRIK